MLEATHMKKAFALTLAQVDPDGRRQGGAQQRGCQRPGRYRALQRLEPALRALPIALGMMVAILASGCQNVRPDRVKVVAIADTCPTNGFAMARTTNTDALERGER